MPAAQHPTTQFFTGQMPFLPPNQQRQSTEGIKKNKKNVTKHPHTGFNGPLSGTTWVSRYQKNKTNLDFTEARNSEWQWHDWAICKSAPHCRQTIMPTPHH